MSQIKLKHSGGNSVIIAAPDSNPASDRTLKLPSDGDGTILTTNSATGKILQTVSVSDSVRETTGSVSLSSLNTYYDTPFAVTITPSSTSSKILLMGHIMGEFTVEDYATMWRIERAISGGATTNIQGASAGSRPVGISVPPAGIYVTNTDSTPTVFNWSGLIDAPSTTSAITYTFQVNSTQTNSVTFYYNRTGGDSDAIDDERGLSWITAQEVAA